MNRSNGVLVLLIAYTTQREYRNSGQLQTGYKSTKLYLKSHCMLLTLNKAHKQYLRLSLTHFVFVVPARCRRKIETVSKLELSRVAVAPG